jgi:predicted component of type VI protein secretion system
MRPLGGGDPIPLNKDELLVGRRKSADVVLDFENVSGKHCQLRMIKGVWHVRDLGSTNGTTVNGHRIASEHGLMPDDELGIAGHLFSIDYDPIAPTSLLDANAILEEEIAATAEDPHQRSLMELAGLESEERVARRLRAQRLAAGAAAVGGSAAGQSPGASPAAASSNPASEAKSPASSQSPAAPRPIIPVEDDFDAVIPENFQAPKREYSDDDFFQMIQEDVEKSGEKSGEKAKNQKSAR